MVEFCGKGSVCDIYESYAVYRLWDLERIEELKQHY